MTITEPIRGGRGGRVIGRPRVVPMIAGYDSVPTFGSLFAGAGGFDMGFEAAGFRCAWQVECDPAANGVRRRHWPDTRHVRDINGMTRRPKRHGHWQDHYERPDVVIGGFPCQDLSTAGRRAGLMHGSRSGLWWQMLRVIRGLRPRCVVFENVPGLLSSDAGRDFARVVFSLADSGYFGAWRVLDGQFFGVPQRRRRVFGVFFGGRSGAARAAEVLALRDGLRGNPPAGGPPGEGVAGAFTHGPRSGGLGGCDPEGGFSAFGGNNTAGPRRVAAGLNGRSTGRYDFETETFVVSRLALSNQGSGGNNICHGAERPDRALDTSGPPGVMTLGRPAPGTRSSERPISVRRLTPLECERLMGWPDGWTEFGADGKRIPDGPRYRLCGNGVIGTVSLWIARRLLPVLETESRSRSRDQTTPAPARNSGPGPPPFPSATATL